MGRLEWARQPMRACCMALAGCGTANAAPAAKACQMLTPVINKVCAEAEIRTDGAATADEPGSSGSTFAKHRRHDGDLPPGAGRMGPPAVYELLSILLYVSADRLGSRYSPAKALALPG